MQVLRDQITQHLGVSLVLLPSYFADAVEAAERAGISGATKGHHLVRYDVHSYVLREGSTLLQAELPSPDGNLL